jgi:hypothetical protein
MKILLFNVFVLFFFLQVRVAYGQNELNMAVRTIIGQVTARADSNAMEKIYLHTDKPFYAVGDTIWFKTYLFNAAYLTPTEKSGIAYLEIADEQNQLVKRMMVPVFMGLGRGNIVLAEKEFPQGSYTVRAYTNWMRNFDEHYIFKKQFYISSPGEKDLLVNSTMGITQEAGKQKAEIDLQLNKIDQQPMALGDFQLKVTEGRKVWYRDKIRASLDGSLHVNFDIPDKADPHKLSVNLQSLKKGEENQVYTIPVIAKRPENTDLQFMPESGSLVAGITTHIAFKALAEDGRGTPVSGIVHNSRQQEVSSFQSAHLGIGSFNLRPEQGETYTAKIKLPDGTYSKPYTLPPVKPSGSVINIINSLESDSLEINISATADLQAANAVYYVIGQSRGVACYAAIIRLKKTGHKMKISKTLFPTGISRFSLLNTNKQVLNERIVFINRDDHLRISVAESKKTFTKRDSVAVNILVANKSGQPVRGNFSVAITDDAQVKNDSLKTNSLKSLMLLSSDLKGTIEDPGYYFPPVLTAAMWQHLDNLLLAQGWVNYDWASVFQRLKPLPNQGEAYFSVKGKVTNIFNKPVKNSGVVLLSKKPSFFRDTLTNQAGIFNFTNIYPSDTAVYVIQARNKNGKSSNVGIEVDEFKAPVFTASTDRIIPWYVNLDSNRLKTLNNYVSVKKEQDKLMGGNMLKEVNITAIKAVKDSKNLNGDGESDFALNQEDLEKAGKLTLGDLLKKNVKGFVLGGRKHPFNYFITGQFAHFIIDGVDIDFARPESAVGLAYRDYVNQYLDYYTAEDIKGIEVMKSARYTGRYGQSFLDPLEIVFDHAFVEITTYSGHGPFLKKVPGVYMYKPVAFTPQVQFYSPKYNSKEDHSFIDNRSTIYWAPDIITGNDGRATFSFYTADKPGTYALTIEGTDMNGNLESTRQKIYVK